MLPDPETVASQVLDIAGQRHPPTDIRTILNKWSQLCVVETDLDGDGFFIDLGEVGGEIFVKRDKNELRKRFTLAHELGHFLLRNHLHKGPNNEEIENWCNKFASELLLLRLMLSKHLKSGGIKNFTKRLCDGPRMFQVSEQAFYLRTTRLFPMSVLHVLLSNSALVIVDEFRNRRLEQLLETNEPVWNAEIESFVEELADIGAEEQRQLRRFDRTWLARRIYKNAAGQKFLLVLLKR